jgi:hypothetical protein
MARWEYYTEWWFVDFNKSELPYRAPPHAAALGEQGWELVSVTSFPWTGSTRAPAGRGEFTNTTIYSVFTSGASFQAFYKRALP